MENDGRTLILNELIDGLSESNLSARELRTIQIALSTVGLIPPSSLPTVRSTWRQDQRRRTSTRRLPHYNTQQCGIGEDKTRRKTNSGTVVRIG